MAKENITDREGFNEILLYTGPDGGGKWIFLKDETIWLTQQNC